MREINNITLVLGKRIVETLFIHTYICSIIHSLD